MDSLSEVILWAAIVGSFFFAFCGYSLAKRRNRRCWLWFFNCWLAGVFALIILACSPTLDYDEELDFQESETLGWVVLFLWGILLGVSVGLLL